MRRTIPSSLAALGVAALLAACTDNDHDPMSVARKTTPVFSRNATARSNSLRQQVANHRRTGLTSDERARVASLRGTWQWVADVHHAAMQDAINDPTLKGLRQQLSHADRCTKAIQFLRKYSPQIEARSGKRFANDSERDANARKIAAKVGACTGDAKQASLFAAPTPIFHKAPALVASVVVSGKTPKQVELENAVGAYHDYLTALVTDLQGAKDLADANDIFDHYVAAAGSDGAVNPIGLQMIAGTVDLARSSAEEWDAFARPHEGSMFMWGWLSAVGNWIVDVVSADVTGCEMGLEAEAADIFASGGWSGPFTDFLYMSAGYCAGGGLFTSLFAAI